jgi:predicted MFS family arabinose efflux permease
MKMSDTSVRRSQADTRAVFAYFTPLTLLVILSGPTTYFVDFATSYMLKDQLHATSEQVANFRLLTAIPAYVAFVFGFARDVWNPLGLRDRGYFMIFGAIAAALFLWLGYAKLTYTNLFIGMFLIMTVSRFISAAYQGLIALIGQEKVMSGQLSALWQIVGSVPQVIGALAGGWVAEHLKPSQTFTALAVISLLLAAMALVNPRAALGRAYDQPLAKTTRIRDDLKRLLSHRAIYPAVLLIFMFQFAPGSNTALQFYLHDKLHASDAVYGEYYAIFAVAFVPMFFIYGWLCKRVSLEKLLWWGTIITIPQLLPLALINSPGQALLLAAPVGMMGGIAAGAYYDLAMRSCPAGLQGTLMMLAEGAFQLSYRGGDVLGAKLYAMSPTHGFLYCALTTTAVYALMLPVLLLVPRNLIRSADGETNAGLEAVAAAAATA